MPLLFTPLFPKRANLRETDAWQAIGRVVRPIFRIFNSNPHVAAATTDAINQQANLYPTDYRENNPVAKKVDKALEGARKRRKRKTTTNMPRGLQKTANVPVDHWGTSQHPRGNGPNANKPLPETLYAENTLANEKNRLLGQEQAMTDIAANKKNLSAVNNTSLQTPYNMQNVFGTTFGNYGTYGSYGLVTSGLLR